MISKRNTLAEPSRSSMELAKPFDVFIIATVDTLGYLCGISMHDLYLDPEACITAYTEGVRRLESMFDERIPLIVPYTTPVIKYGHLNTLGIPLLFPETGQVALDMHPMGLEQVMDLLEAGKGRSFSSELTNVQLHYLKKMRSRFPDKRVHWGWQWEGPLTTLWALAGVESMYAVHDDPTLFKRCMALVTQSIVEYTQYYCEMDGTEVLDPFPDHGRLCDDIAAMYSPDMWPEMVLPFWKQFYQQAPVPEVKLHCEDMHPDHLPLLEGLGITDYDPGISPRLHPSIISRHSWLPFCWRLGSFHYHDMSLTSIHDFVYSAAFAGAGYVFTVMEPLMCTDETVKKVEYLYHSGREVARLLEKGHARTDLLGRLEGTYPTGYWNSWNGYRFS